MLGREILVTGEPVAALVDYFLKVWSHPDTTEVVDKLPTTEQKAKWEKAFETNLNWLREQVKKRGHTYKDQTFKFQNFEWLTNTPDKTTMARVLDYLRQAQPGEHILIESPYFVLYPELYDLLKELRTRGVRITVLVNSPEVSDFGFIGDAFKIDLPRLLELGIEVELIDFKRRITHGKVIVIGNRRVILGSGNMDGRSFNINEEANALIDSPEFAAYLWQHFQKNKHIRSRAYISEAQAVSCEKAVGRRVYLPVPISATKRLVIESFRPQF